MQDEIMTLTEIARYLKVSEKTITRMVQSGRIPGTKVARQWRFVRAAIDDWLNCRIQKLPRKALINVIRTSKRVIPITELVTMKRLLLSVKAGTKEFVLQQLVKPLIGTGVIEDAEEYLERLSDREEVVSTAIGHGLALPHVRASEEGYRSKPCIVLGICKEGTDFESLDGRKTYVFAMPCTNTESSHLRLMAKISMMFRAPGVIKKMRMATVKKDVMDLLSATDSMIRTGL